MMANAAEPAAELLSATTRPMPSPVIPPPPCDCDTDPVKGLKRLFVDYFQGLGMAAGRDPATRPVFLRLHGAAHGTFEVRSDLPAEFRIGLAPTLDFIFQNHDVFFADTAKGPARVEQAGLEIAREAHPGWIRGPSREASGSGSMVLRPSTPNSFKATPMGQFGAERQRLDKLLAIAMLLKAPDASDQDGRTWVESVEDGWWYSTLLPSNSRLVACLFDADLVDHSSLTQEAGYMAKLSQTVHLSELTAGHGGVPWSQPQGSDATTGRLTRGFGARWVAVGDAAISRDPLSSQGVACAMHLGICAGRAIQLTMKGERDALAAYADPLGKIWSTYLTQQRAVYATETRWPNSVFWARRHLG